MALSQRLQSQPVVHYLPPGAEHPVTARVTGFHRSLGGAESVTLRTLGGDEATHRLTLEELKSRRTDLG